MNLAGRHLTGADRYVVRSLLRLAAKIWRRDEIPKTGMDYSTAQNEFLWEAERAYLAEGPG